LSTKYYKGAVAMDFLEEQVHPSLYELAWDAEKELPQISIPNEVVEKILKPDLARRFEVYSGLFEKDKLGLDSYTVLRGDNTWGFGDILSPAESNFPDYSTWSVSHTDNSPFCFSATMYVILSVLTHLQPEEREKLEGKNTLPSKLVEISGMSVGRGKSAISVNIYRGSKEWLDANSSKRILAVKEAMYAVYNKNSGWQHKEYEFRAEVRDDGRPNLACPGDCCCLGAAYNEQWDGLRPWIEMHSHNMDSPDQQYCHFVGLSVMADEIRKFNTK